MKKNISVSLLFLFVLSLSLFSIAYVFSSPKNSILNFKFPKFSTQLAALEGASSGLIGWWKFDENAGTIASDSSGNNNAGTLIGGPIWSTTDYKVGSGALVLNGNGQYVDVPGFSGISGSGVTTVSLWIKPLATGGAVISQWSSGRLLELDTLGTGFSASWRYGGAGGSGATLMNMSGSNTLNLNEWQHIVFVYNNPSSLFYKNGVLLNTATGNGGVLNTGIIDPLRIGRNNIPSYFSGSIDDVRVYSRVLSADEIASLYTSGSGVVQPPVVPITTTPVSTGILISNVQSASVTQTGAIINWTTNVTGDSQVDYGFTNSYGNTSALNLTQTTSHSITLASLTDNTTYHYQVKSRDSSGNLSISGDQTFTTPPIVSVVSAGIQTYTVNQNGSGNFTTIQACANVATAGSTCLVMPGVYPEHVVTKFSGTDEAHRIVFKAQGLVTMRGFDIKHAYITADGFDVTEYTTGFQGHFTITSGGNYCQILNNKIRDGLKNVGGIAFIASNGLAAGNCIIRGNTLSNLNYNFLMIYGSNHLIENNKLEILNSRDYIYLFGHDHIIRRNIFYKGNAIAGVGNHPDFIQTFSDSGGESYNMLFEDNWIQDLDPDVQLGQLNSGGGPNNPILSPNFHDYTFRRNVFVNIGNNLNAGLPGIKFENNTFYRLAYTQGGIIFGGSLTRGNSSNTTLNNNVFVGGGVPNDTYGDRGYYSMSGGLFSKEVLGTIVGDQTVINGIFNDMATKGYMDFNGVPTAKGKALTDVSQFSLSSSYSGYKNSVYDLFIKTVQLDNTIRNTFVNDYNFVSGPQAEGFPTKRHFNEVHGINGGDPKFADVNNPIGPDGIPFTSDDGLRPAPGSPLCGRGLGGTDIGAYLCSGGVNQPITYSLTVNKIGNGTGNITSTGNINCGASCVATLNSGSSLTLTAVPGVSSIFGGWDGDCTGSSLTCTVSLNRNISATATFSLPVVSSDCSQANIRCVDDTPGPTQEYTTIQACANVAQPGDTCLVYPGNYTEHVETVGGGNAQNYLTFKAVNSASNNSTPSNQKSTMKGFRIKNPYVKIDGFDITKYDVGLDMGLITPEATADFCQITNNVIRDGIYLTSFNYYFNAVNKTITNSAGGFVSAGFKPGVLVYISSNFNAQILNHDTVKKVTAVTDTVLAVDDVFTNVPNWKMSTEGPVNSTIYVTRTDKVGVAGISFVISSTSGVADNCVISGNKFINLGGRGMYLGGSNHLVTNNIWDHMNGWRMITLIGSNNIFRYNVFKDSPRWPGFPPPDLSIAHSAGAGSWDMYDTWLWSAPVPEFPTNNNLFEFNILKDIDNELVTTQFLSGSQNASGFIMRNNVFYGIQMSGSFHYPQTQINNNTFVNSAKDSSSNFVIGDSSQGNPVNSTIKNNVFVGNSYAYGSDPGRFGWYSGVSSNLVKNYNFVAGSASSGYPAKSGFVGKETNGINGGDPKFKNINDPLGPDGQPFTADDGLIPLAGSPLCGKGENGDDIGAYSCAITPIVTVAPSVSSPAVYSSNYTAVPPVFSGSGGGGAIPYSPAINTNTLDATLLGNNPAYIKKNSYYIDPGITVTGSRDYLIRIKASVDGKDIGTISDIKLDTSTTTSYTISYSLVDSDGKSATLERKVIITGDGNPPSDKGSLSNNIITPVGEKLNVSNRKLVPIYSFLSFGSRKADVKNLQTFLISQGFMSSKYLTGFYGKITEKAIQSFQTKFRITVPGSPSVTGYGVVGPKTRNIINLIIAGKQN